MLLLLLVTGSEVVKWPGRAGLVGLEWTSDSMDIEDRLLEGLIIQDAFLYCKITGDQLSVISGKATGHTVSNSGLPRQRAIASQKRTAARSTVSAGNCQARSSMCVATSGVVGGTA